MSAVRTERRTGPARDGGAQADALLFQRLFPLIGGLLPRGVRRDPVALWRAECTLASTMVALVVAPLYGLLYMLLGEPVCARLCWAAALLILANAVLLRVPSLTGLSKNVLIGIVFCLLLGLTWRLGGIGAPTVLWLAACPVMAITAGGRALCMRWAVAALAAVLAIAAGDYAGLFPSPAVVDTRLLGAISTLGFLLTLAAVVMIFDRVSAGAIERLGGTLDRLNELAERDELTGVYNRRKVMEVARRVARRAARSGQFYSVCLLDIDHFKSINDRHGHAAGDIVLHEFARGVREQVRAADCFGRYGGEEFLLVLDGVPRAAAIEFAERIRGYVAQQVFAPLGADGRVTASIGVAQCAWGESVEQAISRADAALYAAKHGGRNRVVAAPPPSDAAQPGAQARTQDAAGTLRA